MLLKFKDFTIDTKFFKDIVYVRDFDLVSFTTDDFWAHQPITLNLCFENAEKARDFYFRFQNECGAYNLMDKVDFSDVQCTWPVELADRLDQYNSRFQGRKGKKLLEDRESKCCWG